MTDSNFNNNPNNPQPSNSVSRFLELMEKLKQAQKTPVVPDIPPLTSEEQSRQKAVHGVVFNPEKGHEPPLFPIDEELMLQTINNFLAQASDSFVQQAENFITSPSTTRIFLAEFDALRQYGVTEVLHLLPHLIHFSRHICTLGMQYGYAYAQKEREVKELESMVKPTPSQS